MKKIFVAIVMAITVMSVMVMGPEKAFAATYSNGAVVANDKANDIRRVVTDFRDIARYLEANPNQDFHLVKMMVHHEGDAVVVSTAWMTDDGMKYETDRIDVKDIDELDMETAVINGYYLCHYWI